jgi:hypothetical protein
MLVFMLLLIFVLMLSFAVMMPSPMVFPANAPTVLVHVPFEPMDLLIIITGFASVSLADFVLTLAAYLLKLLLVLAQISELAPFVVRKPRALGISKTAVTKLIKMIDSDFFISASSFVSTGRDASPIPTT